MQFEIRKPVIKVTIVLFRIKMANFDVGKKWATVQLRASMKTLHSNARRITLINLLNDHRQ